VVGGAHGEVMGGGGGSNERLTKWLAWPDVRLDF
jgi:hypothetical protein